MNEEWRAHFEKQYGHWTTEHLWSRKLYRELEREVYNAGVSLGNIFDTEGVEIEDEFHLIVRQKYRTAAFPWQKPLRAITWEYNCWLDVLPRFWEVYAAVEDMPRFCWRCSRAWRWVALNPCADCMGNFIAGGFAPDIWRPALIRYAKEHAQRGATPVVACASRWRGGLVVLMREWHALRRLARARAGLCIRRRAVDWLYAPGGPMAARTYARWEERMPKKIM